MGTASHRQVLRSTLLVVLLLAVSPAWSQELEGARAVESLPASSWLRRPPYRLRMGVGEPVRLDGAGFSWIEGRVLLGAESSVEAGLSALGAGGFSARGARVGLRIGLAGLALSGSVLRVEKSVAGVARTSGTRTEFSLGLVAGPVRGGMRLTTPWPSRAMVMTPGRFTLAAQAEGAGWAVGLERRDSAWQDAGHWRGGVWWVLAPSLALALRGGMDGGFLVLSARRGAMVLTVSFPVASPIPLGPFLALHWQSPEGKLAP